MTVSGATFERFALEADPEVWELVCGRPRRKPDEMTIEHNFGSRELLAQLVEQLPRREYQASLNAGHLKRDDKH